MTFESVAQLIARLGPPPTDITQAWLDELPRVIGKEPPTHFRVDDPVWESVRVTSEGRLILSSELQNAESPQAGSPQAGSSKFNEIDESINKDVLDQNGQLSKEKQASRSKQPPWRQFVLPVIAVCLFGIIGVLVWNASQKNQTAANSELKDKVRLQKKTRNDGNQGSASTTTNNRLDAEAELSEVFEMADSSSSVDLQTPQNNIELDSGLSLDAFLPPSITSITIGEDPQQSTNESVVASENPSRPADDLLDTGPTATDELTSDSMPDLLAEDSETDKSIIDSAKERSTVLGGSVAEKTIGIELPIPPRRSGDIVTNPAFLFESQSTPKAWTLEFPEEPAPFLLQNLNDGDIGEIVTPENRVTIARFESNPNEPQRWNFVWLDAARQVSQTDKLASGRIRTDGGETIFLRPLLNFDPIPISLTKRDEKLKWNLRANVPSNAATLRVNVTVPKDVELQWLEPIEGQPIRKTRGVFVCNLKTSIATAIVARIDVRTSSTLSMRIRFGARLDPQMPWQWTDAKSIRQSFEQVTRQLEMADRQLLDLDVAISRADRMRARRQEYLLEEQRDRIDEAVKNWTIIAKRFAELDQLVAFLDAGGSITPELSIEWPDKQQVIFSAAE